MKCKLHVQYARHPGFGKVETETVLKERPTSLIYLTAQIIANQASVSPFFR